MLASLRKAGSLARVGAMFLSFAYLTFFQAASAGQKRFLSIHEYQSMKLLNDVRFFIHHYVSMLIFKQYGIATPKSISAKSPQEAYDVAKNFGSHSAFKPLNRLTCNIKVARSW